jgi:hypothetical protein
MPAKINSIPEVKTFRLELMDKRYNIPDDAPSTVDIVTSTFSGNSKRSQEFSKFKVERGDGKEITYYDWSYYKLVLHEVYLTLVGCNLQGSNGPLFAFKSTPKGPKLAMSFEEFAEAFGLLDDDGAVEIHTKVLEMNPQWSVGGKPEDVDLGEGS